MRGAIEVPLPSGVVNGLIFILVDLIALWAVHRGLLALQGFHLFQLISCGRKVRLQRSRVPILSGELLGQQTARPHVLVLANALFILLAFAGTMGVNGESSDKLAPAALAYVSRIRAHPDLDYAGRARLRPRIFLRCRTSNASGVYYWAGAFNVSRNARLLDLYNFVDDRGVQHHVNLSTLACQDDNPRMPPMLTVRDCHPPESGCSAAIDPRRAHVRLAPASAAAGGGGKPWRDERVGLAAELGLIVIYRTVQASSDTGVAAPGDRLVCLELSPRGSDLAQGQGRLNCFLLRWGARSAEARIAFGRMFILERDWRDIDRIELPLEITTATATLRWDYATLGEKFFADGLRDLGVSSYSLTDVLDNAVSRAVTADVPLVPVFCPMRQSVTVIEHYAFACLAVVAFCALALVGLKEAILCALGRETMEAGLAIHANRYDTVSALLHAELERNALSLERGESAELGMVIARNSVRSGAAGAHKNVGENFGP